MKSLRIGVVFLICITFVSLSSPACAESISQSNGKLISRSEGISLGDAGDTFNPTSWKSDKARIAGLRQENLNKEEDCNIRWKILWGHAKQGNLEARATLSMLAFPVWPFSPQIVIPGRSGDTISSFRDTVILAIHSNGYQFSEEKEQAKYVTHLNVLYSDLLKVFPQGQGYLSCIESQDDVSSCS